MTTLEQAVTKHLFAMQELATCISTNRTLADRFAVQLGAYYQSDAELRAALDAQAADADTPTHEHFYFPAGDMRARCVVCNAPRDDSHVIA